MQSLNRTYSRVEKPKLLDQVRQAIRTVHYRCRTEEAYLYWIKQYIFYHKKRHPDKMGANEVNQFLTHLAVSNAGISKPVGCHTLKDIRLQPPCWKLVTILGLFKSYCVTST